MSVSRWLVVFLLPFSFLALSLCSGFFAAPVTCPPSDVVEVVEALRSPQCPLWIERSVSDEVNGDTLDKELAHAQDGTHYSVFFYASWRPFSQKCRSIFDTLSSMFRQIRHLAVEQYSAMPSVFSRYGIHGFPASVLTSRTASARYHGLKDLDSSVDFYRELKGANMKSKKIMKKPRRESGISSLPPELLEGILLQALAASPTPIRDIRYFRQTCKNFHAICSSKRIGKCMNVEDWSMCWQDKQGYLGFLQSCAKSENVNALFLLGLEEMFNRRKYDVGLHHLRLASSQGHLLSKYLMGLWWVRDDSSRSHGIHLLKEVSGNIHQCRRQASQIFSKMIWQKWPSLSFIRCEDLSCGTSALQGDNLWLHEEHVKRRFCSDVCKWTHEYKMFINMRYLSAW